MTRRPLDATTGLTHTRGSMGDGTIRGKARIATPYDPRRLRTAARAGSGAGPTPVGHTVTMRADGVTSTGKVTWSTAVRGSGFIDTDPDPRVRIVGYYDVDVRVTTNDGPVRDLVLTVTIGETVTTLSCPFLTAWEETIPDVLGAPGDRVELEVAWSGSADVDVQMTVGLDEPLAAIATEPPLPLPTVFQSCDDGSSLGDEAFTLTLGPPTCVEGDTLICIVNGGAMRSTGSVQEWETDSAFTEIVALPDGTRSRATVGHKVASAADEAGTSSYQWKFRNSNGLNAVTGAIVNLQQSNLAFAGATAQFSGASPASLSAALAGGDYTFAACIFHLAQTISGSPSGTIVEGGPQLGSCGINLDTRKPRFRYTATTNPGGVQFDTSGVNNTWLVTFGVEEA